MEYISATHQGLLAYVINELYEHECSDQLLLNAIESSGFDYYEKFLNFRADVDERGKDWEGTWKKFIASIDMLTRDSFQ